MSNGNDKMKKVAMGLAGLLNLFPYRLVINASSYAIVRFQLPPSKVGLFINKFNNPLEISVIFGTLSINILSWCKVKSDIIRYISIAIHWLYLIIHLILLLIYSSGGTEGNLTAYYWAIMVAGYLSGASDTCVLSVNGQDVAYFTTAIPLSGMLMSGYHLVFLKCVNGSTTYETSYNIVYYQIIISILIIFVASILWTMSFSRNTTSSSTEGSDGGSTISEVISQMGLTVVGMGLLPVIYPGIAPYQLISMEEGRIIDAYCTLISIFPSLTFSIMSALKLHVSTDKKWEGDLKFWHFTWILVIIYLVLAIIFFYVLYYPGSALSKYIIGDNIVVGCLTFMFLLLHETIIAIGFNGVGPHGPFYNSLNMLLGLGTMTALGFIGDGHLTTYRMYSRKNWPTEGFTNFQAFKFWCRGTMSNTWYNIKTSFNIDIRGVFSNMK
ncbi:Tpr related protein, putative [Babesia microti strain RI]|uniref:Tpr related protein, putative n=1 Tax=Babesia microti (strain RI) TaxID=1133968 RepID=I7J525_BABMR|nr:Tpr related protein, putative [Babesia microti strain RI]CCF72476.1 Tpr related protein, putative [Babesia microti strain RI]|eukprot:XP_012647086.1 Tpr related protein, putative [Babesia microti strain RI]